MSLVTLDFNDLVYTLIPAQSTDVAWTGIIHEEGFTVDNMTTADADQEFATFRQGGGHDHDTSDDVPFVTYAGTDIRLTKDDAAAFDLVSLQLDTRDSGSGGSSVTIVGTKVGGGTVEHIVVLDSLLTLETFTLPETFRDLTRVDIDGPQGFQFNDLITRVYSFGSEGEDSSSKGTDEPVAIKLLGGNDSFAFDSFFNSGDVVDGGEGTDTFSFSGGLTATLGGGSVSNITNFEILLLLSGTYNLTLANAFLDAGETLTVNAASLAALEVLSFNGAAETNGSFTIVAGAANDSLTGGSGNDVLNGGSGADSMTGGIGNDTYKVDNVGDVIVETTGEGSDSLASAFSYVLAAGVSVET